jgi:hypothetical protein
MIVGTIGYQQWEISTWLSPHWKITLQRQKWLLEFAYTLLGDSPIKRISVHEVLRSMEAKGISRRLDS